MHFGSSAEELEKDNVGVTTPKKMVPASPKTPPSVYLKPVVG